MILNFLIFWRFRTAINVLGDSIGAGIVYELSKNDLEDTNKKTEGGFEAVPMTEIEDDNKWKKKLHQKQDSEFRPADLIFRIPIANFLTIPVLLWACYREAKKKSRAQKLTKLVNPEYEGLRKRKSRQNLENKNRSSSSPNYYITKGQYSRYCFDRRGYFLLKIFRNSLKLELKRKQ